MQTGRKMGIVALVLAAAQAWTLDVAEEELKSVGGTSVEFVNYEGPHDRIDTIEQILGIGRALASLAGNASGTATYAGKYRIIHAVDPAATGALDADILELTSAAEVDHVVNLRRILGGYLERAYSYTLADALLLSEFITVYNAVYRGRLSYFEERYKPAVVSHLDAGAVGIDTVYSEWPGKTQLVIPLSERADVGGLGSLDSDVLTEKEVIEELRAREDRGIPVRKEITELKEREVDQELKRIEEQRARVDADMERVRREREAVEAERSALAEDGEKAAEGAAQSDTGETSQPREAQLDVRDRELSDQEAELRREEQKLALQEAEQAARIERIQQEREAIAADERKLKEQEVPSGLVSGVGAASAASRTILLLSTRVESGVVLARLVYLDPATSVIVAESSVDTIRGRRVYSFGESLLAVAGEPDEEAHLVLVDVEKLETGTVGTQPVFGESWIEVEPDGATVLAVVLDAGAWWIGRFDGNLDMTTRSTVPVLPYAVFRVADGVVYTQSPEGGIIALSTATLALTRKSE